MNHDSVAQFFGPPCVIIIFMPDLQHSMGRYGLTRRFEWALISMLRHTVSFNFIDIMSSCYVYSQKNEANTKRGANKLWEFYMYLECTAP